MSQMINNFEKLAEKYKFTNPVSPEIQKMVLQMRKKLLVNVLKQQGAYSFFFGKVLTVFFAARRLKLSISFAASKIIVVSLAILLAGSVTLGAVYLYTDIYTDPGKKTIKKEQIHKKDETRIRPVVPPVTRADYGIHVFKGSGETKKITDLVFKYMRKFSTTKKVVYLHDRQRTQVKKIVTGTVRTLGSTIIIMVKILDVETGKLLFATEKMVEKQEDVDQMCIEISKKIVQSMGI